MSAKRKYRTPNEYLKYLKGELSREERYTFERDLQADPFEMDAIEGMEQVPVGELEEDLLSLHANMHKRLKRRRRRTFYYAAASIASLLIVGTVFLNIYNINPKSAQETISNDETFLQEESALQSEAPEQEIPEKEVVPPQVTVQADAPVTEQSEISEEARLVERAQELMETPDQEEIIYQEEKALGAVEMVSDEAEAPVPVSKADELVVMEAQPRRSQKKSRAQEAPAQYSTGRVSGVVVSSEDMEPLPGASIMVKGSDSGMVADLDGRFTLMTDQQAQTTVIASYIGMETEEYQLAGGTENRVVMQPDMTTLDEVVVIGSEEDNKYSGAEPEGGLEAYKMYIEEQIRFPSGDTISKREVVVLKFNVESDGSISRINALRSPGNSFTEEAIRLLNDGPSWNPAKNENGATDDVVRMRIVFRK